MHRNFLAFRFYHASCDDVVDDFGATQYDQVVIFVAGVVHFLFYPILEPEKLNEEF